MQTDVSVNWCGNCFANLPQFKNVSLPPASGHCFCLISRCVCNLTSGIGRRQPLKSAPCCYSGIYKSRQKSLNSLPRLWCHSTGPFSWQWTTRCTCTGDRWQQVESDSRQCLPTVLWLAQAPPKSRSWSNYAPSTSLHDFQTAGYSHTTLKPQQDWQLSPTHLPSGWKRICSDCNLVNDVQLNKNSTCLNVLVVSYLST